ncbi:ankyrin repeat domain-containing protein 17-like isoform X7 [Haliotis rubra]|uniref:ankyrin repeat domain-containing protein 17-like isoform X5 n=1 Tax=Haliotis rubra TaxID=36100 RepID=UPI001EE57241|nr:ankyrin repeat domain-containing protein 17-like isoform X5 [Haliotis rubra]XP_046567574.1 ankyrin repeat domain-containing protein 17-like isoform X7 [Haliotis rubra]
MEVSAVIYFSLLLCAVSIVQAAPRIGTLAKRVRLMERAINVWKRSAVDSETKMLEKFEELELTLKEELTRTYVPPLIKSLVKQAMTDILREDFIGNIISTLVLDEVHSLKAKVQFTKTQLKVQAQQLRHVEQERETYRKSVRKTRRRLTKDIRDLQLQLNETAAALRDARTTTYPLTTAASTDPSPSNTASLAPVTTQDSDLHATTDPSPNTTVPPTPVTTHDSDPHATPSPAAGRRLFSASKDGDLETVKRILAAGHVDINTRGGYITTPVMAAAWNRHSDVVEFLVGRGADVSLVDRNGDNVLHWACYGGDLETVKLIVSRNLLDINSRGYNSWTPVMEAARYGHSDVVEFLVGRGADVSLVDGDGDNILHFACMGGDLEKVKLIVSRNLADVNARNNDGETAVDWARYKGHPRVAEFLVSRGGH